MQSNNPALQAAFFFGSFFHPEDGDEMFLRNGG
jgi:hypothetical protein